MCKENVIFKKAVIWQAVSPLTNTLVHHIKTHSNKAVNNTLTASLSISLLLLNLPHGGKQSFTTTAIKQKVYIIDRFISYCNSLHEYYFAH